MNRAVGPATGRTDRENQKEKDMPEPTPRGLREITYASAYVNATLAISEAAIEVLLEGPDSHDPDVARAAKQVLDAQTKPLERWMEKLGDMVLRHHPNPENMETPPSHASYAMRIKEATENYENHMETRFPEILSENKPPHTTDSAFYTFAIAMIATNRAVRRLAWEIASREKGSPGRLAYTEALMEIGTKADMKQSPWQDEALSSLTSMNDRKKRFLERAIAATEDTQTIMEMYQNAGPGEQEQGEVPWIRLRLIVVTLPGMETITGMDDARELAREWGTELVEENSTFRDRGARSSWRNSRPT